MLEDDDYTIAIRYLQLNQWNNLRLFIDEKCELLDITASFTNDEVDIKQAQYCQELESIVLDQVINSIV